MWVQIVIVVFFSLSPASDSAVLSSIREVAIIAGNNFPPFGERIWPVGDQSRYEPFGSKLLPKMKCLNQIQTMN